MSRLNPRHGLARLAVAFSCLVATACASTGGPIPQDRTTCTAIGAVLGGALGAVVAHNEGEGETDEKLAGGALGAAGGALLGSLLCGEERLPPQAPSARIVANPQRGEAPLEVQLEAVGSDPDGSIVRYAWQLGDGEEAQGARIGHTYTDPGTYDVTLLVTDDDDQTTRAQARIQVTAPAPPAAEDPEPTTSRRLVLRGINFGFDSANISEDDALILDVAAEQLAADPAVGVRVVGHTDSIGADSYNQALSERRARAVVEYFVRKGLDRARFTAEGRGEASPVASNETRDGRSQNRRVELEIRE